MLTNQILSRVSVFVIGLLMSGCIGSSGTVIIGGANKQATEERQLSTPHLAGSSLEVKTPNGVIDVAADPALTEVKVTAKVVGIGETEEEAKARLAEVVIVINRRNDQMLELTAEIPKVKNNVVGSCSFSVRVPDAKNCKAESGNGSLTLNGIKGEANAQTDNGSINVTDAGGAVRAESGSGSLTIKKTGGDVDARTDNGTVAVSDAAGKVKINSGSGSLSIAKSAGDVEAHTDNGSINVSDGGGTVKVKSGSGSIDITKPAGAVEAQTDNGTVTIQDAPADVSGRSGSGSLKLLRIKGAVKGKTGNGQITLDQLAGSVEAHSGSGSITFTASEGSNSVFNLKSDNGSITVRLPSSAGGTIKADTGNGRVNVEGPRKPTSVTGERESKQIVITETGPQSRVHSGSGSITVVVQ
jgi:hypothetical protein